MNRLTFTFLISACSLSTANAAVISHDWKIPGDGLLTYDDVNQREWLDLTQTKLAQFPGIDREAKYQYVISQLEPQGMFAGFTVAKGDDVTSMAESAGVDVLSTSYALNEPATSALTDLLGRTTRPTLIYSAGLLDQVNTSVPAIRLGAEIFAFPNSGATGQAGLSVNSFSDGLFNPLPGVMLFRAAIPEPPALLIILGCVVLKGGLR